jgi:hypothetical protein
LLFHVAAAPERTQSVPDIGVTADFLN